MKQHLFKHASRAAAMAAIVGTGVLFVGSNPAAAQPRDHVEVGSLTCDISAGLGLIVGSQREMRCLFTPSESGPRSAYVGTITRFGLDVGATAGGQMAWAVYAPTTRDFGALTGDYVGASAGATVGVGGAVNVLVGGSDRTITLQPLSVEGTAGLNVAAGVSELRLRPAR